jgi:putative ABC transport system permease protein
MIRNYITIGWRNIRKSWFYSSVNILGLSFGIAFALVAGAFVWSEIQVDRQLDQVDRQFIIQSKWKDPDMGYGLGSLGPLAKAAREQYPHTHTSLRIITDTMASLQTYQKVTRFFANQ